MSQNTLPLNRLVHGNGKKGNLADYYFADGFTDTDDVIPLGNVDGILSVAFLYFDFFDFDAYDTVYFQNTSYRGVLYMDAAIVCADLDRSRFGLGNTLLKAIFGRYGRER